MSKISNIYIALFDYFDEILLVLSATSGSISGASFATVIASEVLVYCFLLVTKLLKKTFKNNEKNEKETQ